MEYSQKLHFTSTCVVSYYTLTLCKMNFNLLFKTTWTPHATDNCMLCVLSIFSESTMYEAEVSILLLIASTNVSLNVL